MSGIIYLQNIPFLVNGQEHRFLGDVNGNLKVSAISNITQFGNNPIVTGIGLSGLGIPRVTVSADSFPLNQNVTGNFLTDVQLRANPLSVISHAGIDLNTSALALENNGNLANIKVKTDNIDVLLSSRLKPSDTLSAVDTIKNTVYVQDKLHYPSSSTPITASSGNVANQNAIANLPSAIGKTCYITGFEITAGGAGTEAIKIVTIIGTISGTLTYLFGVVKGSTVICNPLIVSFYPAIPANATNVPIVVTLPALGTGNTNAAVIAHGYYQ